MRSFFAPLAILVLAAAAGCVPAVRPVSDAIRIPTDTCEWRRDSTTVVHRFRDPDGPYSARRLDKVLQFIFDNGDFTPVSGSWRVQRKSSRSFGIAYDSCEHRHQISISTELNNMHIAAVDLRSPRKRKSDGLRPRMHLEEWTFRTQAEADTALRLIMVVYADRREVTGLLEKRYEHFLPDGPRLYVLSAGGRFSEDLTKEYAAGLRRFLAGHPD